MAGKQGAIHDVPVFRKAPRRSRFKIEIRRIDTVFARWSGAFRPCSPAEREPGGVEGDEPAAHEKLGHGGWVEGSPPGCRLLKFGQGDMVPKSREALLYSSSFRRAEGGKGT